MLSFLLLLFAAYGLVVVPADCFQVDAADCKGKCGDVEIKFPFGMGPNHCFLDDPFEIVCINGTTPILKKLDVEVTEISLTDMIHDNGFDWSRLSTGEEGRPVQNDFIVVKGPLMYSSCTGRKASNSTFTLNGTPYFFSSTNRFVAVGCPYLTVFAAPRLGVVGCYTKCSNGSSIVDRNINACGGVDCCQTTLPYGSDYLTQAFDVEFKHESHGQMAEDDCRYAFLAHERLFWPEPSKVNIHNILDTQVVPVALDWFVDEAALKKLGMNLPWASSESFARLSAHTNTMADQLQPYKCILRKPYNTRVRYYFSCFCTYGYGGNPYLKRCEDIDECQDPDPPCSGRCRNTRGSYECVDRSRITRITSIALASGIAAVLLSLAVRRSSKLINQRRMLQLRQKNFKKNGGLLLEQQLHSAGAGTYVEKSRVFNSHELEKATDGFSKNRILGEGGQGTVYKGMLEDGRIIAVKRSIAINEGRVGQFINEVIILSQINHRNVVKLLGCCLETEVPLLVYEFIPNGTLYQYLHNPDEDLLLSWEMRLQIAVEVAGAVSYLHSASSFPIYHRDIKSSNILLDEKYRAKVADFGASKSLSINQTHVTTIVAGTFGYLDPEYFRSSQFTDKSDVYSFGVVLVELLTGQQPVLELGPEEHRSLAAHFISVMEEDQLLDIVDAQILQGVQDTSGREEIAAVAGLAKRCLDMSGRRRPTMKEVAVELERIRMVGHRDEDVEYQSTESMLPSSDDCDFSMSDVDDAMTITSDGHSPLPVVTV